MRKFNDITYSLKRYDNLEGSFTKISNDVYKMTNGNEFKIYSYLCSNYNRELGYAFPSLNVIAENTNMSVKTVQRAIKKLEEIGLIKIHKFEEKNSKYINNIYRIYYPIIIKNALEDEKRRKREEELYQAFREMDEEVVDKVHTFKVETEEDKE